ncbi:hypothetical protein P879_09521 [Paragonimus westermani]|uniref:Uncharacterized protein n=1 Tax=Paragonimus westermani TaxID=34504 RepID=A0A8T0D973_9TREM|nr:hypothetical protein P879_09521 [Paragonimus westermani]
MHQLVTILIVYSYICCCDSATFETEMLIYRCHSYFRRVTTDGSYQRFVEQYIRKHCDSHLSLSVLMIRLQYITCQSKINITIGPETACRNAKRATNFWTTMTVAYSTYTNRTPGRFTDRTVAPTPYMTYARKVLNWRGDIPGVALRKCFQ